MSPVPRWSGLEGRRDETKGKALMGVAEKEETLLSLARGKKEEKDLSVRCWQREKGT